MEQRQRLDRTLRLILLTAIAGVGCAVSEPLDLPAGGSSGADAASGSIGGTGAGGDPGAAGTAGVTGTAGTTGAAGAGVSGAAGQSGSSGIAGSSATGRAGTSGNNVIGVSGRDGGTGAGGRGGSTGAAGTIGTGGGTIADGGTATFTAVYADVISKYCFGSACHDPAGGDRPSFASQAACYAFFKNQGQLYPGKDPNTSYIYFIMHGDPTASPPSPPYMPPDPNAKVSADDLAIVAAWIAAGALDD